MVTHSLESHAIDFLTFSSSQEHAEKETADPAERHNSHDAGSLDPEHFVDGSVTVNKIDNGLIARIRCQCGNDGPSHIPAGGIAILALGQIFAHLPSDTTDLSGGLFQGQHARPKNGPVQIGSHQVLVGLSFGLGIWEEGALL